MMKIGILAVQGAFIEHEQILQKLGVETVELRQLSDLSSSLQGIILPGGESTAMGKLLTDLQMMEPLRNMISQGLPVMGTCAGMILLAKEVENPSKNQITLGTMDITVLRNAYGRQLGSFHSVADFGDYKDFPMTFIRAPYISSTGPQAEVLSTVDGHIVAARQGNQLATAFHPELTSDTRIHQYFLDMAASAGV
jgi:5'-phosphate synthase pdxT subunit